MKKVELRVGIRIPYPEVLSEEGKRKSRFQAYPKGGTNQEGVAETGSRGLRFTKGNKKFRLPIVAKRLGGQKKEKKCREVQCTGGNLSVTVNSGLENRPRWGFAVFRSG